MEQFRLITMVTKDSLSEGPWPSDMPQVQSSNYKFSQIGISRFGLPTRSHERQDNSISKSISAHSKTYRRIRLECDYQSGFGQIRILHSVDLTNDFYKIWAQSQFYPKMKEFGEIV